MGLFDRPKPPSPEKIIDAAVAGLIKALPQVNQLTNQNILPYEQARLGAAQAVSPGYTKLAGQDRDMAAGIDADILRGSGLDLVRALTGASEAADPEYYKTRELTADKIAELLGSYDLSGLSGGEAAAVERAIGAGASRTNPNFVGSPMQTIQNALQFSDAFDRKRANLGAAINTATSFIPTAKSMDVNQAVFGRPSNNMSQFANVGETPTQTSQGIFSGAMNYGGQRAIALTDKPSTGEMVFSALPDC